MADLPAIDSIYLARDIRNLGLDERRYRREVATGSMVRLHRGAFADAREAEKWDGHLAYRMKCIAAAAASRSSIVLSHESAAAIHSIPRLGRPPELVHILVSMEAGTRTEHGFRKHGTRFREDDVELRDGAYVTSLVRTLVDLASTGTLLSAVVALDWAFSTERRPPGATPVTATDLRACADRISLKRGLRLFDCALNLADGRVESVGESVSRVLIYLLGFPLPELQHVFRDYRGFIGRSDFYWPEFRLAGEFDGLAKYLREEFRRSMSPGEVVVAEKKREDRIRALGDSVTRWDWSHFTPPQRLYDHLRAAGLPSSRHSAAAHSLALR